MSNRQFFGTGEIVESAALVAGVTLLAHLVAAHLSIANLALLYLLPVMVQSGRAGLGAGLFTSVIAAIAFNFFLVPPRYTLHVADADNLVTMLLLFAVALAVSNLAARMRAQAALAERLAGDRRREDFREALLSSISHDLRSPITAIRTGLETLVCEPGKTAALAEVRSETARLERMVTNLLAMTRIEAGAPAATGDVLDLTDTVASVIDALPPGQQEGIAISLPDDLPLVRGDPHMLHHMLLNMVDNALCHGGARNVAISARRDGSTLLISVSDRGPGIPAGQEQDIFARFHRSAGTTGSGLGLAIVRGFGNAMGLTVAAENRADGPGACFTVRFPKRLLVTSPGAGAK